MKKFVHSLALKAAISFTILRQRPGMVRSAAVRRSAFNLPKACSIGLRSGEYFGRPAKQRPVQHVAHFGLRIVVARHFADLRLEPLHALLGRTRAQISKTVRFVPRE